MKTLVTVIQIAPNKFDVFMFNGETQKSIYPQTREKGILITCWDSNVQNDKYCFSLAETMNKN